jgi:hypothetical protein
MFIERRKKEMFKAIFWREFKRYIRKFKQTPNLNKIFRVIYIVIFFLFSILLSLLDDSTPWNGLFFFLISSTLFVASSATNFKEDWNREMFDYILAMPISPNGYVLSVSLFGALMTTFFVIPTSLVLALIMLFIFKGSFTLIVFFYILLIPFVLGFLIALSNSTYLLFSLKVQWVYGIIYLIFFFVSIIILPFLQLIRQIDISWIHFTSVSISIFFMIDILIVVFLDKEKAVIKQ